MKSKTVGISLLLVICSVLFAWYAIGAIHTGATADQGSSTLNNPLNTTFSSNITKIFECKAESNTSEGIKNVTLWLTLSGGAMAYNLTNTTAMANSNATNASFIFSQFNITEGLWFWNCKANNGSGYTNVSLTDGVVIIDTTAPTVSFNSSTTVQLQTNDSYLNPNLTSSILTLAVVVSELWPANISYKVSMENGSAPVANTTNLNTGATLYNLTLLSAKVNLTATNGSLGEDINSSQEYDCGGRDAFDNARLLVVINVTDKANLETTLRRTITIDSINPWANISYPGGYASDSNVSERIFKANATSISIPFSISQRDTNLQNTSYRLSPSTGFANFSFTPNSTILFTLNATSQNGTRDITFITKDKAGRETINSTRITLDLAPVVSVSYPTSGIWATTGSNILFNFTAINNDTNTSTLHTCELWGNMVGANASYLMNMSIWAYNGTPSTNYVANGTLTNFTRNLLEGNYTWAIWCNDTTGNNIYTANRTLYVDLTAPVPSVTVAESTGRSTIGLSDTVTLTCSATDSLNGVSTGPTASVTKVTKPDGSTITNPGTSLANIDQTGTYTVYCQADDTAGYTATTTTTFIAQYSSLGGSTSNGGGAGVVKTQTITIPGILPGSPNLVKLADPQEYALKQIEIDVLNAVTDVTITVKKLAEKPADATSEAADTADDVYKYIEVIKENMLDADIKKASIAFQVPKSWLKDKGATKEQITLKRLKGSSWTKLATTITDEDDDYVYYKASAPGLSYFAVVIEEKPAVVTAEEEAAAEAAIEEGAAEELAPAEAAPSRTGLWITLAALIVVIAGVAAAVIYFKKKR